MSSLFKLLIGLTTAFVSLPTLAQVFDGRTLQAIDLADRLQKIKPGTIIVIGENHNQKTHQNQQLQIMKILKSFGHSVHTGLEFVYYPDQEKLNQFLDGLLSEDQFLKAINWAGDNFEFYRDQILFPNTNDGEFAWALNLPRSITGKIAKQGLDSLSEDEKILLPPDFTLGRPFYKERFMKSMPHLDPAKAENYFISQSAWDDTMAWKATEIMRRYSDSVLVIVSGDFHVAYGGGLPDKLRLRGINSVFTISQLNSEGLTPEEIIKEISPLKEEVRADLVWAEDISGNRR